MSRPARVPIPELDDYEDEAIAVALMKLGPRARVVLEAAAKMARDGFDPNVDRLVYHPKDAPPRAKKTPAPEFDGQAFAADVVEAFARGLRGGQARR